MCKHLTIAISLPVEALGCNIMLDGAAVSSCISECGFGFLFAQMFHPSMKNVAPVRKEIGVKTIFNLLGPLTNPANPSLQVTGVGSKSLGPLFAELFKAKGTSRGMIVHSTDGLDEISPAAPTTAWILENGKIEEKVIDPSTFGLPKHSLDLVQGGTAAERAALFREILSGGKKRKGEGASHEATKDYIIANAASGLWVSGKAKDFKEAAVMARYSLFSLDGAPQRRPDACACVMCRKCRRNLLVSLFACLLAWVLIPSSRPPSLQGGD